MSRPETSALTPPAPESGAPVFDEPWQAQTIALAYALAENGAFSSAQWAKTLGAKLREAESAGKPDNQQTYYNAALTALECLLAKTGAVSGESLGERIEAWRRAYLNTPHGQPVELAAGTKR